MNEMENNEIMEIEETTMEPEVVEEEQRSGIGTGLAMLIGAGLAIAGAKAVKFAKKKYDEHKAKKESASDANGKVADITDQVSEEVEETEE